MHQQKHVFPRKFINCSTKDLELAVNEMKKNVKRDFQEHNSHQSWLVAREQTSQKIGQPIVILNKSINVQAEIITNTIFNLQGKVFTFWHLKRLLYYPSPYLRVT